MCTDDIVWVIPEQLAALSLGQRSVTLCFNSVQGWVFNTLLPKYKTARHWLVIRTISSILHSCSSFTLPQAIQYVEWISSRGHSISSRGTRLQLSRKTNAKIHRGKFQFHSDTSFFPLWSKSRFFFPRLFQSRADCVPQQCQHWCWDMFVKDTLSSYTAAHTLFCSSHWAHREDFLQNCVYIGRVIPIQ